MARGETKIDVRSYWDLRAFLETHVESMKLRNPSWSLAVWAPHLGLTSKTSLVRILQGERLPGPKLTRGLAEYFKFEPAELAHFRNLIQLQKSRPGRALSDALMAELRDRAPEPVEVEIDDQTAAAMAHGYSAVILAFASSRMKNLTPERIAQMLRVPVPPEQIQVAIDRLVAVKLLKRTGSGRLRLSKTWQVYQPVWLKSTGREIQRVRLRFYREVLGNTIDSIDELGISDLVTVLSCFPTRSDKRVEAKRLITQFAKRFEKLLEDEEASEIFQLQIQFLPITMARCKPP